MLKVVADYCEFGTCDEKTEYCCGENKCCKKTVDVWYYWYVFLITNLLIFLITNIFVNTCFNM